MQNTKSGSVLCSTFYLLTDFQNFMALFRTSGMQKGDHIILYVGVSEQVDMQKEGFRRMV